MRSSTISRILSVATLSLLLASCSGGSSGGGAGTTLIGSGETLSAGMASSDLSVLLMRADMLTARPGDDVTYTVLVRNTTQSVLLNAEIAITLPLAKLTVREAADGTVTDGRITWGIPQLMVGETRSYTYRATLQPSLRTGDVVRTVVSFRADNLQEPATGQVEVRVGESVAAGGTESSSSVSPLSFFLGDVGSSSSSSSGSVVPAVITVQNGQVTIRQVADHSEVQAGDRVRYTITVSAVSGLPVTDLSVQVTFPDKTLRVTDAGKGAIAGDRIVWALPRLEAGASRTFSYAGRIASTLKQDDVVTTIAEVASVGSTQVATTSVRILGRVPQVGADSKYFAPLEDTGKYLRPIK